MTSSTQNAKIAVKKAGAVTKRNNQTLSSLLKEMIPEIQKALPSHMDASRMARIALTTVRTTPKLLECSRESFLGALMTSAQLGLEPGPLALVNFVPYYNSKTKKMEVQFQIGYRGYLELMRRSGTVESVHADVVKEKDVFEYEYGLNPKLRHVPYLEGERGKLKYAYAVVKFKNGGYSFLVMGREEIEKIRSVSKSANLQYSPWNMWEEEMWKKTVIKRLAKMLPLSVELQREVSMDEITRVDTGELEEVVDVTDWDMPVTVVEPDTEKPDTEGH